MGFKMEFGGFGNECATCGVASCVCGESPVKRCINHLSRAGTSGRRPGGSTIKRTIRKIKKFVKGTREDISHTHRNIKKNRKVNKEIKRRTKINKKGGKTSHTSHTSPRTLKSTDENNYSNFGR
jgi:hypothetical protein